VRRDVLDRSSWACLLLLIAALAGCQPAIGDDCQLSTDCSAAGDRLCDTTQPGGYCTVFNCEPGTCPEDSICVAYGSRPSTASGCHDPQGGSRFQRAFCLARCDEDGDCRSGYACIDLSKRNPWGAVVVEPGASRGEVNGKVCVVPFSAQPVPEDGNVGVCVGPDAAPDAPPWTPGGSDSGASDAGDAAEAAPDAEGGSDEASSDSGDASSDA